jgi:S1-C subfamily serine protease
VTFVDLFVVVWILASAAFGARRGLLVQLFSLAGLLAGAFIGSRLGPRFVGDGEASPWLPLIGLLGGVAGAAVLETAARALKGRVAPGPLDVVDMAGGIVLGAVFGLSVAWLFAILALQQPALGLRRQVQRSALLPVLVDAVPPGDVLRALNRFDPLPFIPAFPDRALPPPDPSVLQDPSIRAAARSVVKIEGTSCGVGVQGSGWVVRRGLVATNAHVIAGEDDTRVLALNGQSRGATVVFVDAKNDAALLRVPGLSVAPLRLATSNARQHVVLLGYPHNGPLTAVAGTAGRPAGVVTRDAYGRGPVVRTVVPLRGGVREGDSGGPAVDADGRVVAMMFAATRNRRGGFAVPRSVVERAIRKPRHHVASGPCVG